MKLLVVNADAAVCSAVAGHFWRTGFAVDCAGTLQVALERLAKLPPYDAVIVDLLLSRLDPSQGLRAMTEARARSSRTRLIALVGSGCREQEWDAVVGGADAIIPESFTLSGLAQVVNSLMDHSWPLKRQS
jgi:DNA-binding response OmpR family regulator